MIGSDRFRHLRPEETICTNRDELHYLPRSAWPDLQALLPFFEEVPAQVALATTINFLNDWRNHSVRRPLACWGGEGMVPDIPEIVTSAQCGLLLPINSSKIMQAHGDEAQTKQTCSCHKEI